MMQVFPLEKVFNLIEPGPVVLVSTLYKGRPNLMAMSWHMMVEFTPPLIACVLGPRDYSYKALKASGECVIAVPTVDMAATVVDIGNCSGADVDKFKKFALTALPAAKVKAPLVRECLANIECKVADETLLKKYGLVVLEAVQAWRQAKPRETRTFHARGDGTFVADGRIMNLKARMTKFPEVL